MDRGLRDPRGFSRPRVAGDDPYTLDTLDRWFVCERSVYQGRSWKVLQLDYKLLEENWQLLCCEGVIGTGRVACSSRCDISGKLPDKCLGAGCTVWAVTAVNWFASEFFGRLGLQPNFQRVSFASPEGTSA